MKKIIRETKIMNNLDTIVERVVKISDDLSSVRKFLSFIGTEEDLAKASHVHLITADLPTGIRFLHGFFMDQADEHLKEDPDFQRGMEVGTRHDLVNILRRGKPQTFDDLLMLVTFFLYSGPHNLDQLPVRPFVSNGSFANRVLDEILSKSRGYVVWGYETERLMAIFERDSGVRRDLLRDFRLLRPRATEWMAQQSFDEHLSLKEAIEQRSWVRLPVAQYPPMSFAFRLYTLLFSNEFVAASDQGGHRNN